MTAAVSGGVPPYYYSWNGIDFFQTWPANETGTYYLTVTDSYGCQASDSIEIIITSIKQMGESIAKITLNPNPSNDFVIASISSDERGKDQTLTLQMIDVGGKLMIETEQIIRNKETNIKLDVSSFPSGTYIINSFIDGKILGSSSLIIKQP